MKVLYKMIPTKVDREKRDNHFRLPKALKFAWLIRQDVRNGRDVDDIEAQKDFVAWWILHGEKEYPNVEPIDDSTKSVLFEPLDAYPKQGHFGVSRLLHHIYIARDDIRKLYDIDTVEGVVSFNQWFYIYGLEECGLGKRISSKVIEELNQPIVDFWQPKAVDSKLPKISPLMFFLWSVREDIQDVFDIDTIDGRERFLGWFFLQGVTELKLGSLLSNYWLDWVQEKVSLKNAVEVSRVGLLFWAFREDIQDAFDLDTQEGQKGLAEWTENALSTEPSCQWIEELSKPQQTQNTQIQLGVNLIGFAFGELGIGEDVRMAAAACDKAGIPYTVVNIPPGETVRQNDKALAGSITEVDQLKYPTNIFCLTGFDTVHVFLKKGSELFEGRYNIGWWPWELPVWPEQWHSAFDLIDEVWAATTYTQEMYQQATDKPVTLMPLPVSVERAVPVKRKSLGLVKKQFLFLYIFDFNSYLDRKNPKAVVKAFLEAFPDKDKNVGLVVKTMNSNSKNPKWKKFQKLCQKDSRIVLLEKTLDREKVLGLIDTCDAYITLHRAEGFGRTPAEAMLFGKPVVATDFSGNTDFVNKNTGFPVKWDKKQVKVGQYPFITKKSNAYWAEPNISHAATQMQAALKSAGDKKRANEVKQFALQQFSLLRISELMKNRLIQIRST